MWSELDPWRKRIRAGEYIVYDQFHCLKDGNAYHCDKPHKTRGGGHCPGRRPHLSVAWVVTHTPTGERVGEFPSLVKAKAFIRNKLNLPPEERKPVSLTSAYNEAKQGREAALGDSEREWEVLPAGKANYKITAVKVDEDKKGRGYIKFTLESSEAKGNHLFYMEPMSTSETAREVWERVTGKNMLGLGFDPSKYPTDDAARREFVRWAPTLKGAVVATFIKHNDAGFVSVYYDRVVTPSPAAASAAELVADAFDGEVSDDDSIIF